MLSAPSVPLPPQSIDAERAILGALLIEGTAGYRRLTALARPDQFLFEAHRHIFTAVAQLADRGDAIDLLTVTEELRRIGQLEATGGPANLALLVEHAAILVNVPAYEKIVVEEAMKRAYLQLAMRLREAATNGSRPAELLEMVDDVITEHRRQVARRRPDEAPTELTALLAHQFAARADVIGHGILPKQALMVLGGRAKLGKTNLTANMKLQRARGLAWLSFPTDPGVTLWLCPELAAPAIQLRMRTMLLHDEAGPIPEGRIHVKTTRGLALDEPEGLATVAGWIEETGADLVVADPLARLMVGHENDTRDMGKVVKAIDSLIDRLGVSVVIVHHVGKPQKDNPRQGGDRLRGAGALFAAADSVGMLDRDNDAFTLSWELRHAEPPAPQRLRRTDDLWMVPAGLSDEDQEVATIVSVISMTHDGLVGAIKEDSRCSKSTAKRRLKSALASGAIAKDGRRYIAGPAYRGSRVHEGSLSD